jgi:hypothetical protein
MSYTRIVVEAKSISFTTGRARLFIFIFLLLLSKQNPLRWALVWLS